MDEMNGYLSEVKRKPDQEEVRPNINTENLNYTKGFAKRFPTVKKRVVSILKNDEYARRNYLWLCLVYWSKMGQIKIIIPKENFFSVNSSETIGRAFRKVMAEARSGNPKLNFLLKDEETIERRKDRELEMHGYFQTEKNSEIARMVK